MSVATATIDEQGVTILFDDDDVTSYFQLVSLLNKKGNK
jgi:hypothetical protein